MEVGHRNYHNTNLVGEGGDVRTGRTSFYAPVPPGESSGDACLDVGGSLSRDHHVCLVYEERLWAAEPQSGGLLCVWGGGDVIKNKISILRLK